MLKWLTTPTFRWAGGIFVSLFAFHHSYFAYVIIWYYDTQNTILYMRNHICDIFIYISRQCYLAISAILICMYQVMHRLQPTLCVWFDTCIVPISKHKYCKIHQMIRWKVQILSYFKLLHTYQRWDICIEAPDLPNAPGQISPRFIDASYQHSKSKS